MQLFKQSAMRVRVEQSAPAVFVAYVCIASFTAYCCMYAMRKPFTAGSYAGLEWMGVQYKIILVVCQVIGYALSKFIGIRVISRMVPAHRAYWIIVLLSMAMLSLLGFALTPFPYNAFWMFLNGIPLGMIWGLLFGYLEGRRTTEILTAALSVNFIVSSGFVKSIGAWLLNEWGVAAFWMPFIAAVIFFPLLICSVWMLEQIPPPNAQDMAARAPRQPMTAQDRRRLWQQYAPGFIMLVVVYLILTIIRDVRDNFAVEIWAELGFSGKASILTLAEIPVALLALIGLSILILVKNNFKALWLNHILTVGAAILLAAATFLFQRGFLAPQAWMILSGFALFVPYIVFNGILFDRFLAAFREPGNVGFLMYIADAIGYLGSVLVLLWRNFGFSNWSWLEFYCFLCYAGSAIFGAFMLLSLRYFSNKFQHQSVAFQDKLIALNHERKSV
jgi:hypothetical protein